MKKDAFYFSHDYNARNDFKIKKLIMKHGMLGYGIFWSIIEDLYNNTNVLRLDYESISFDLRITENVIESILNDFDLFIIDGDNFGSISVQTRLNERNAKSIKARESILKRWNKKEIDTNVLQTNYDGNTIKEKKVKEIKGNDILLKKETKYNFRNELIKYGFDSELVDEWLMVRKAKKAVNTKTAFNSFIFEVKKGNPNVDFNEILKLCVQNSWAGFKNEWITNQKTNINGKSTNTQESREQAIREFGK